VLSTCNYVAEAATRLTMQLRQRHSLNQDKKYLRDVRDKLNMKTNTNELARIAPDLIPGKGGHGHCAAQFVQLLAQLQQAGCFVAPAA